MNRANKTLSNFAIGLGSLSLLVTQGVFANGVLRLQDPDTTIGASKGSGQLSSMFSNQEAFILPDFESGALHLAQTSTGAGSAGSASTANNASSPAAPKKMSASDHESLASKATNPISNLVQLQFQNSFIPDSYESTGYSNVFLVQPVIPIKLSDDGFFKFMITRTTLPVITTPDFDGPGSGTTGLGDMNIVALPVHEQKIGSWGAMWGVGLASDIPTATDHRTGSGKFTLGPSAVLMLLPNKSVQGGILAYHKWEVAGDSDRSYVSMTTVQPLFTYHFEELFGQEGWYAGFGDTMWTYDWNAQQLDLPISVRFGRVFKAGKVPLSVFFEPFGRPVNNGPTGKYGFKLNVTFLFPTGK